MVGGGAERGEEGGAEPGGVWRAGGRGRPGIRHRGGRIWPHGAGLRLQWREGCAAVDGAVARGPRGGGGGGVARATRRQRRRHEGHAAAEAASARGPRGGGGGGDSAGSSARTRMTPMPMPRGVVTTPVTSCSPLRQRQRRERPLGDSSRACLDGSGRPAATPCKTRQ
uniref:Uncharacterized protein n=1 Tax=Oryza sativa subsp. japonica TaxID=39947 RepID=Q69KA5_ORYSJ|nr:hypothetical protein [Oryza sativa Japonica Group]